MMMAINQLASRFHIVESEISVSILCCINIVIFKWAAKTFFDVRTAAELIENVVGGACSDLWELTNQSRLSFSRGEL